MIIATSKSSADPPTIIAKSPEIANGSPPETGASKNLYRDSDEPIKINTHDIENTISFITQIPKKNLSTTDVENLKDIETKLKTVIFGQDEAIKVLSNAIKLSRVGLRDDNKTIGSFLFTGPTGVGKTEISKQLSTILGVPLLRLDMSEYMERHALSRLIAAPPGYVGSDQGGLLTDSVTCLLYTSPSPRD